MQGKANNSGGVGLEGSCAGPGRDWMQSRAGQDGVELFQAWMQQATYHKHRHATYGIGLTETGSQIFDYRGVERISTPGKVIVLHPDEVHDGRAGSATGLGYRLIYVEPALIYEAVLAVSGRGALPFSPSPVVNSPRLAAAVRAAFLGSREPLARDSLLLGLAEGLLEAAPPFRPTPGPRRLDEAALARARRFLDAEINRVVRSSELEELTGLSRYELARQFRRQNGTSPYRYSLLRRLDFARSRLASSRPTAEIALEAGFADQAHFTRMFRGAYGLTPARYRSLRRKDQARG